jgi:hypothetical protein
VAEAMSDKLAAIEITPEMIEAGLDELYSIDLASPPEGALETALKAAFFRMLELQKKHHL